jgi:hypothetical protein
VQQANGRKISSEELIKYAHKISASNAVAAPSTWGIGKLILKRFSEFYPHYYIGNR